MKKPNHILLKLILIAALLTLARTGDIIFEDVKNVAIFEKLEKTTLNINCYHTFIHKLEIQPLYQTFLDIKLLLEATNNNDRYKNIKVDEALIRQEENLKIIIYQEFAKFKPIKKNKRGLFNFVESIEKEIFGVATENDLQTFDVKLNVLLSNEKKQSKKSIHIYQY